MRRRSSASVLSLFVSQAIVLLAFATAASAQTFTVLHNFGSKAGDPYQPGHAGAIAQGRDGNMYSATPGGGSSTRGAKIGRAHV
jgi:hypothetical protein